MTSVNASTDTTRKDASDAFASKKLHQEQDSDTGFYELESNLTTNSSDDLSAERITCEMQQRKSQYDVKQEENSGTIPVKEPSNLCQKQNPKTGKQEPYDLTHDISETLSCKNEKDSDKMMQKPSSNPSDPVHEPNPPLVSNLTSVTREMVSDIMLSVQSTRGPPASQSDILKPSNSVRSEKAVEKLQPRRNPDAGGCSSQSDQVTDPLSLSEKLSSIPKEKPQNSNVDPRHCLDAKIHSSVSKEEKCTSIEKEAVSENLLQMSCLRVGVPISQSDQENFTYSMKSEKAEKLQPRRNPDPVVPGSHSDVESTPSKVLDRGLDDGYNWRKYGQKLVKGNEFIRSYYKCTYLNCQAKKQVERSHDGCKTDVNYLGNHQHPQPHHTTQVTSAFQVRHPETPMVTSSRNIEPTIDQGCADQHTATAEASHQSTVARSAEGVTALVSCSNNDKDDCPDSKRQKREVTTSEDNLVNKPNIDSRHVVQTLSEVDIINDGYRWRKYGQKLVKGNPNPRSYYRCSNTGCPVKKHVERASHDSKVVITTYEGQHDHDMPPSRTISQSIAGADANAITTNGDSTSKPEDIIANGESRSKPDENNPVKLEMVVHVRAN